MVMDSHWLKETETFFFNSVGFGRAGGNNGSLLFPAGKAVPGLDDWREAGYGDHLGFGGYHFADRWGTDPHSGRPSGSLFITHWGIPVWGMWVGGEPYSKDVFPFLRTALMESYRKREFCGGRGPQTFQADSLLYTNEFEGTFERFSGSEQIDRVLDNGKRDYAGSHQYWGGSFLYLSRP